MPYFRKEKNAENPYAQIHNRLLEDKSLSFKAKGLLCYLLSREDSWTVYQTQLANVGTDGEDAVRSALDELREADYIHRFQRRDDNGKFLGYIHIICEEPRSREDVSGMGFSESGESGAGESGAGKARTTNTDSNQNGSNQNGGGPPPPGRESAGEKPPISEEDAVSLAEEEDIPEDVARKWWHWHNSRGWDRPIKNPRSALIKWHLDEDAFSGKTSETIEDLKGQKFTEPEVENVLSEFNELEWSDFGFAEHDGNGQPLYTFVR